MTLFLDRPLVLSTASRWRTRTPLATLGTHADSQAYTHITHTHTHTRPRSHVHCTLTALPCSLPDVSVWLKSYLVGYMKSNEKSLGEVNCRIINPSYMIRSVPPHVEDRQYCGLLAIHAVHGAHCCCSL